MEKEEALIGPRSDERKNLQIDEFHNADGEPLYMSLVKESEDGVLKREDVEEAKNKLAEIMNKHPEEVKNCQNLKTEDCRKILENLN